jgi:hypothetical protein
MKMCGRVLIAMFCLVVSTGVAVAQHTYSKAVQKACAKRIAASMGLKPRPFAFAWTVQVKG